MNSNLIKVALVGNPNVGKSLFFNHLSGTYVDVSNFPGTTVTITSAEYQSKYIIYDTPGIYGISSYNDEEMVARDVILDADIVINIVNSLSIDRDLFLTQQLIDMGKSVAVMLNFSDERKKRKIKIDTQLLSNLLGVPVFETAAVTRSGFENIDKAISKASEGNPVSVIRERAKKFYDNVGSHQSAILCAEGDTAVAEHFSIAPGDTDDREFIYITRRNYLNDIIAQVEYEDSSKGKLFNTLGMAAINPVTGIPMLIAVLFLMYFLIGDLVSRRVVNFTENTIGHNIFEFQLKKIVGNYTPVNITINPLGENGEPLDPQKFTFPNSISADPALKNKMHETLAHPYEKMSFYFPHPAARFLFGEFGVISMTITYLLFLLLPLVLAFYFSMAFLEDSGYLPRLATMMDRSLMRLGLNGKAIIPIMLGFGCVTMATLTTRILGTQREKTIATAILQFVIPCSAQLAVITFLMARAGFVPLVIYVTVIFSVLIILSTLLNRSLPGTSSPLLLDLPMMQMPKLGNLLKKTYHRTVGFMQEAAVWFFIGAAIVGFLEVTGALLIIQDILAPLTVFWLKLPREASNAFIMGLVRRDFGTAGLFEINLTAMQKTVAIITITLFVPCIASLMVMLKERGIKEGMIIWAGTWIVAFSAGGIVAQIFIH